MSIQVLDEVCDSTVISSVDQLPSVRRLKGKIVPSPFVKDAMVSVVNKDNRKPKAKLHPLGKWRNFTYFVDILSHFLLFQTLTSPLHLCGSMTRRSTRHHPFYTGWALIRSRVIRSAL
jgi:hypothetical protein